MKVNLHNLRERVIDGLFDVIDSKPMRFVVDRPRHVGLILSLIMAAFYFGFVTRTPMPHAMLMGIICGSAFIALAVFCCWLHYRETHPRSLKGEPPFPIPPCPSRFGSPALATLRPGPNWPRPQGLSRDAGTSSLVLPPLPGPSPLGKIEPSPDWPHRQ